MANIFDYLDWRADVPFSAAPFNEVDNLILAKLAYTDFSGIVPSDGTKVQLSDACRLFFSQHTHEEIRANTSFTAKAPLLMEKMTEGQRFGSMTLRYYVEKSGDGFQFSAVTFDLADRTEYVAFRGTDGTVAGWKEDFNFTFMDETEGQRLAVQYLNRIKGKVRVGGHSKGGNFAMYAGMFCDPAVREKILTIYSNDGPGFHDEVMATDSYRAAKDKIVSIIPESSVVGMLLENQLSHILVKSTEDGFKQHDPLSWRVKRTKFVRAPELSSSSALLDATLTQWLGTLDIKERKIFVDSLFDTIAASGAMTIEEMNSNPVKCYSAIIKASTKLSKKKQKVISDAFGKLARTGRDVFMENMQTKVEGIVDEIKKPRGNKEDKIEEKPKEKAKEKPEPAAT